MSKTVLRVDGQLTTVFSINRVVSQGDALCTMFLNITAELSKHKMQILRHIGTRSIQLCVYADARQL